MATRMCPSRSHTNWSCAPSRLWSSSRAATTAPAPVPPRMGETSTEAEATAASGGEVTGSLSDGQIIVSQEIGPNIDLYSIQPDGQNVERLTRSAGEAGRPDISPEQHDRLRGLCWRPCGNRADRRRRRQPACSHPGRLPGSARVVAGWQHDRLRARPFSRRQRSVADGRRWQRPAPADPQPVHERKREPRGRCLRHRPDVLRPARSHPQPGESSTFFLLRPMARGCGPPAASARAVSVAIGAQSGSTPKTPRCCSGTACPHRSAVTSLIILAWPYA